MADQDLTIYNGMMIPKSIVGKLKAEQNRLEDVHSIYAGPVVSTYASTTNFPGAAEAYQSINDSYIQALFAPGNYDSSSTRRNGRGNGDGNCEGSDCADSTDGVGSGSGAYGTSGLECEGKDKDTQACKDLAAGKAAREAAEKAAKEAADKAAREAAERAAKEAADKAGKLDCEGKDKDTQACKDLAAAKAAKDAAGNGTGNGAGNGVGGDLKERKPGSGIYTSDPSTDIPIDVKKNQWISKVTKALYGVGENTDDGNKLYEAIKDLNGLDNKDRIYPATTLKFPQKIKIGDKEYDVDPKKSTSELQEAADYNRTHIHSRFGGSVRPSGAATPAPAESPAPAANTSAETPDKKDSADTTTPGKTMGSGRGQTLAHPNTGTTITITLDPIGFAKKHNVIAGSAMVALGGPALLVPGALLTLARPIRSAFRWARDGVENAAGNELTRIVKKNPEFAATLSKQVATPENMDPITASASKSLQDHPENVKPLIVTYVPMGLDEVAKPENIARFKPIIKELAPMGLEELSKPENVAKMQPIINAILHDPKVLEAISQMTSKAVKDNSGTITKDVLHGLLESADNQVLLQRVFEGLAKQIVTKDDNGNHSELIKQIADVAFNTFMKSINDTSTGYDEQIQQYLDKTFDSRGLAGGAMVRSKGEQEKAKKSLQQTK